MVTYQKSSMLEGFEASFAKLFGLILLNLIKKKSKFLDGWFHKFLKCAHFCVLLGFSTDYTQV